jgi:hypothetical protein
MGFGAVFLRRHRASAGVVVSDQDMAGAVQEGKRRDHAQIDSHAGRRLRRVFMQAFVNEPLPGVQKNRQDALVPLAVQPFFDIRFGFLPRIQRRSSFGWLFCMDSFRYIPDEIQIYGRGFTDALDLRQFTGPSL